jgi:hypothetical protein
MLSPGKRRIPLCTQVCEAQSASETHTPPSATTMRL